MFRYPPFLFFCVCALLNEIELIAYVWIFFYIEPITFYYGDPACYVN